MRKKWVKFRYRRWIERKWGNVQSETLSISSHFSHSLSISTSFSHSLSIFSQPGCQAATSCATLNPLGLFRAENIYSLCLFIQLSFNLCLIKSNTTFERVFIPHPIIMSLLFYMLCHQFARPLRLYIFNIENLSNLISSKKVPFSIFASFIQLSWVCCIKKQKLISTCQSN